MFNPVEPNRADLERYIQDAQLSGANPDVAYRYAQKLAEFAGSISKTEMQSADVESLFTYRVPELTADGCSRLDGVLAPEPYQLYRTLGLSPTELQSSDEAFRIFLLDRIVDRVTLDTAMNWLGFYERRTVQTGPALVKLVYRGLASRAEFPLTREFARMSNNSTVGLSGKSVVINDIEKYLWEQGGPYYQCDSKVLSEACLPITRQSDQSILGIIDAESFERQKFVGDDLSILAATAVTISSMFRPT